MSKLYSKSVKVTKQFLTDAVITKEQIEKDFIYKFLNELPLDKLKEIVNFKEFDYENKELCNEAIDNYSYGLQEKLNHLKSLKAIEFNASLIL